MSSLSIQRSRRSPCADPSAQLFCRSATPSNSSGSQRATRSRRHTRRRSQLPWNRRRRSSDASTSMNTRSPPERVGQCTIARSRFRMSLEQTMTDFTCAETLRNGLAVTIRHLRVDDRERIAKAVRQLERESIYTRLFSYRNELTEVG